MVVLEIVNPAVSLIEVSGMRMRVLFAFVWSTLIFDENTVGIPVSARRIQFPLGVTDGLGTDTSYRVGVNVFAGTVMDAMFVLPILNLIVEFVEVSVFWATIDQV